MSLTFPRDLVFEAYLGPTLGWVDLTTYLSQTTNVTTVRGRRGEQVRPAPSTLTCRLDDRTGNMTPGNPMGAYYGLLTQYTPVRLSLRLGVDAFSRLVANGWGSSPTDGAYTTSGGAAGDYAVDSAKATHATAAASSKRRSWLGDLSYLRNYEVRVRLPALSAPASGTAIHGIMLRGTAATACLAADLRVSSAGVIQVASRYGDDNTFMVAPFDVGTLTAGHVWYLAAQVEGQALRAKVWDATSGVEPYEWVAAGNDDGLFVPPAGPTGWVGLRSQCTSASAYTYAYDDLEVRINRFYGEAAEFLPQWDESHRVRWVDFAAADLTRRMGKASKRWARSAIQRYVEQNAILPRGYWPMDVGELALSSNPSNSPLARPAIMYDGNNSGVAVRTFGTGSLAPWLRNTAEVKTSLVLLCRLTASGFTAPGSSSTVHTAIRYDNRYTDAGHTDGFVVGNNDAQWTLTFKSQSYELDLAGPAGPSVGTVTSQDFYNGSLHHLAVRTTQNGAAVDWALIIDGATVLSGSLAATTNPALQRVAFAQNAGNESSQSRILGHVLIYDGDGPPLTEVYAAMVGHPGERAGRRAQRICAEEGIPFTYVGDLDDTELMGPQFQDTELDVLQECAVTDGATLVGSRSSTGFVFRTYRSRTQPTAVVLDYAAGQVSRPLRPARDDKDVVNLVTVRRRAGGEVVVEQTTGPLNTGDPGTDPTAAGVNDAAVDVNTADEVQLAALGQRVVARGTVPGDRYPLVRVNLRAPEVGSTLQAQLLGADADDRLTVQNLAAAKIFDPVDQVARGYTEVYRHAQAHEVSLDCAPYAPYRTFVLDSDRIDADDSTLASGVAAGLVLPYTISVATAAGSPLWTTDGAQFPLDVVVAGQRLTLSGISGAASPQTFTVSARANGVDKAQIAGAKVTLADPGVLG